MSENARKTERGHWDRAHAGTIRLRLPAPLRVDTLNFMRLARRYGIETRPSFHPVHTMPMYNSGERFEVAEDLGIRGINLPSYPDLSDSDIKNITDRIKELYDKN